jgi:hypothetical protein
MSSGFICAWPRCERAAKYTKLNANGVPVRVCKAHAAMGFPVPLSRRKCRYCIHDEHSGMCTGRNGGTANVCACIHSSCGEGA